MPKVTTIGIVMLLGAVVPTQGTLGQPQTTQSVLPPPAQAGDSTDLKGISQDLARQAEALRQNIPTRLKKLQEIEADLEKNLHDTEGAGKRVDDLLGLLSESANMIGPDSKYAATLRREEDVIRDLAKRAESDPDPENQKQADYFKGKASEVQSIRNESVELRTRLMAEIDRLGKLKRRLEFADSVQQIEDFIKGARVYLDNVQTTANEAQGLANGLSTFGKPPLTQ